MGAKGMVLSLAESVSGQNTQRLRVLAEEVCLRENCRLYDLELVGSGAGRVLRVFIDRDGSADNKEPVSIDDCANVSQGLSLQLDVEDLIAGDGYQLEVSTPGLERQLSESWHFETVVGKSVRVWLLRPLLEIVGETADAPESWAKRKHIESVLLAKSDENITLRADGIDVHVPFSEIEKAKSVFEFQKTKGPEKKKSAKGKRKKR